MKLNIAGDSIRVRIVGVGGLNPPVILSTLQLMLLEVPQGVGHNPQQ